MEKIKLTRESVSMGDDTDAPHVLEIEIQPNWTILEILKYILKLNYLPHIYGGKATWSVAINEPIAVLSQESFEKPMMICLPDYPYQETMRFVNIENIHFNYHAQKNPEEVYEVLSRFRVK
jgi:hypothetical protein